MRSLMAECQRTRSTGCRSNEHVAMEAILVNYRGKIPEACRTASS